MDLLELLCFTEPINLSVLFIIAVIFISRAPWRRRSTIARWPSSLCPIEWWISSRSRGTSPSLNSLSFTHLSRTCWTTRTPRRAKERPPSCQRWLYFPSRNNTQLSDKDFVEWLCVSAPQDHVLAQLLQTCKDQIVSFHEHESLLDHKQEEELSEAERKAAWAEYQAEVKSCSLRCISVWWSFMSWTLYRVLRYSSVCLLNVKMSSSRPTLQPARTRTPYIRRPMSSFWYTWILLSKAFS